MLTTLSLILAAAVLAIVVKLVLDCTFGDGSDE